MAREKFDFLIVNNALLMIGLMINSHSLGGNKQPNESLAK